MCGIYCFRAVFIPRKCPYPELIQRAPNIEYSWLTFKRVYTLSNLKLINFQLMHTFTTFEFPDVAQKLKKEYFVNLR